MSKNSDGTTGTQGNSMTRVKYLEHKRITAIKDRADAYHCFYWTLRKEIRLRPHCFKVVAYNGMRRYISNLKSSTFVCDGGEGYFARVYSK